MGCKSLFTLLVVVGVVHADVCLEADTCAECISRPQCSWCSDEFQQAPRCRSRQYQTCSLTEDPVGDVAVLHDQALDPDTINSLMLIKPQRVKIRVRPQAQSRQELRFQTAQSRKYPLDIYFLLDLSWSMKQSRINFARQASSVIEAIKTITDDVKVGFGSFIDKNLPPFASPYSHFNCPPENPKCTPAYSFFHQISLTSVNDVEQFKNDVLAAPLGGNIDEPEGTLDALMQVMVCWDRVGWRHKSRKIIVVSTDRDFHYALDGKLIGILEPNDGKCHLNGTRGPGYYSMEKKLDYPSLSQVNHVAQSKKFVLVFAVTANQQQPFRDLSRLVQESFVEILMDDASNIVQIISERYADISTTVKMRVDNVPDGLSVRLTSDCNGALSSAEYVDSCEGVNIGTSVSFTAHVSATKCLAHPVNFSLSPVGIDQALWVEVDTLCHCDCEQNVDQGSDQCSARGDRICQACRCHQGYFGARCECSQTSSAPDVGHESACRGPDNSVCSGQGRCECGQCRCEPGHSGRLCECDDGPCRTDGEELCSGHGECECGECVCRTGWTGQHCSCQTDQERCMSPYNRQLCSGFGSCQCNSCAQCSQNPQVGGFHTGDFCQLYPDEIHPCKVSRECVECLAFESGPLKDKCASTCGFYVKVIHTEQAEPGVCSFTNDKGCSYSYNVSFEGAEAGVVIQLYSSPSGVSEQCPQVSATNIGIGVFVALLILGLIGVALYKWVIVIKDRREYAHFLKQSASVKMSEHSTPLYKPPITTYLNPMYSASDGKEQQQSLLRSNLKKDM